MKPGSYNWVKSVTVLENTIKVLSKPKIPTEIAEAMKLKNIRSDILSVLLKSGIVRILNPKAKLGRLYGLTETGQKVRKRLLKETGLPYSYSEPKEDSSFWYSYGRVVSGLQRKAIIKAVNKANEKGKIKLGMTPREIRTTAREYNKRISRSNANETLINLVKEGLLKFEKLNGRVTYSLTKKGLKIQQQLLIE